jgi:hypothetical protein
LVIWEISLALCLDHGPSIRASLRSWDIRHMTPCPPIGWDGGLSNFLPGLALNFDPPDFSLPSS